MSVAMTGHRRTGTASFIYSHYNGLKIFSLELSENCDLYIAQNSSFLSKIN